MPVTNRHTHKLTIFVSYCRNESIADQFLLRTVCKVPARQTPNQCLRLSYAEPR